MAEDPDAQAQPLTDAELEQIEGGVYVQEAPSGVKAQSGRKGAVLLFDEADAVTVPVVPGAVFEPNDNP